MSNGERRKTERVRTYHPVRIYKQREPKVVETLTKDVSAGGVRCVSPQLFPISSDLGVEMTLFKGEESLSVKGKAVWFRMLPHSDQFDLGISFLELSPQDKRRLSAYLGRFTEPRETSQAV
ncbi:MAG: PilZ domain-containing protein [Candidatus Omnitrophica bacterium]|nr:PilZ domain-containing protein [Candidatus Omnitrophota bacterium]